MSTWTSDELDRLGSADELSLASVRRDGTLRRPVTMLLVRDGDDVYVRSVNGQGSSSSIVAPKARAATLEHVPR